MGDIYADNEVMSEYSKFMGYLGDYYQITPEMCIRDSRIRVHGTALHGGHSPAVAHGA